MSLGNLPKVTKIVNDKSVIQTQTTPQSFVWVAKLSCLSHYTREMAINAILNTTSY